MTLELEDDQDQPEGWQKTGTMRSRWQKVLAEYAPEYLQAWTDWTSQTRTRQEIDAKTYELVVTAINATIGRPSPYMDSHIHKAFKDGATIRELVELFVACGHFMGPHAMNHGLNILYKVIKEREALSLPTPRTRADQ